MEEDDSQVKKESYASDIHLIRESHVRIKSFIHQTPVLSSESINAASGKQLFFKCECFQKGGSFKFRGACNAVFSLDDREAARGVVTHSSGNHAAALALAAKLRGIPAYVVIPKNAPKCKVENVIRYGGQIIWSEPTLQSRESTASKVIEETGAVLLHPFNDRRIISGQGTIALELLDQVQQIDTIIVPISGGGLISGVALAAKSINPAIRVLAAEPRGADDAAQSKEAGRIITLPETNTIADGLRAYLGDLTWPIVRDLVDDVITVEDKDIIKAMRLCFEILKIVVEPSGAIGLAVVMSDTFKKHPSWKNCSRIGIIFSGAVDDECKLRFLELKAKRSYRFIVFKIEQQQVMIDKLGGPTETYDDFTASMPPDECRYAVFDFDFITSENCQRSKIFFVAWSPDASRVRSKMVYASSKDRFKRELDGIQFELQATDPSEMSLDIVRGRVL